MSFDRARALADAVLLEGYVLYPYRASSTKNRFRWAFGILAPRAWSEADGSEPWWLESQCLVRPRGAMPRIDGRLRFIQQQTRRIEQQQGGGFAPVETLEVDGKLHLPWEEGVIQELSFAHALGGAPTTQRWHIEGGRLVEELRDASGELRGRVVRERSPLEGTIAIRSEPCGDGLHRVSVRVENVAGTPAPGAHREQMLPFACIATHLLMRAADAGFVSLIDPPEAAKAAAAQTRSVRTFPVLVGEEGRDDLVLSAPIILYDHAKLAPESPGDFFDATEIDELLTLRTATLTPEEKREARATDPRAAELIDRVERMTPEQRERLHGALRDVHRGEMIPRRDPPPDHFAAPGKRVRLKPNPARRTDAQDLLFEGFTATVEALLTDDQDRQYAAVTLDADPAADLHRWYGRYFYYYLDELEPLEAPPR
ncbi:MAG: hypothetical protein IRZ16_10605 [Myxococcaceae bacterium]|nr:hypothetical protein [Myxococcaceae bacterium]